MIGAVDKNLRKFAVIFYLEDNKSCFGAIHAFFGLKVKQQKTKKRMVYIREKRKKSIF